MATGDTFVHQDQSAKADGADATLVQPSWWNKQHKIGQLLTNKSGSQRVANDVVVADPDNDGGVELTTTVADLRQVFIVQATIADNAEGLHKAQGIATVAVQGAVTRGHTLRTSATSGKAESTGTTALVNGAFAIALTGAAGPGAGTVTAYLLGHTATSGSAIYAVRGLTGVNNSGTPNTQYDLAAQAVTLIDAAATSAVTRLNTGTVTVNIATAGPTANGRDQAGAFTSSSFINLYYIWNGSTLATIASAAAPPTGPTLPTGYTHWAYAMTVRLDGSGNLLRVVTRGAHVFYRTLQNVVNASTSLTETQVDLSTLVPSLAASARLHFRMKNQENGGAQTLKIRLESGSDNFLTIEARTANNSQMENDLTADVPLVSQSFYYDQDTTGSAASFYADVMGYRVPNGGE